MALETNPTTNTEKKMPKIRRQSYIHQPATLPGEADLAADVRWAVSPDRPWNTKYEALTIHFQSPTPSETLYGVGGTPTVDVYGGYEIAALSKLLRAIADQIEAWSLERDVQHDLTKLDLTTEGD